MQMAALQAAGIDGSYELCDVPPSDLPAFFTAMRGGAYAGCNVTIPHKAAAAALCDRLEADAERLGVANTITLRDGALIGTNTDAEGFAMALRQGGLLPPPGARAVVLGAGGAAAAVAMALARVPVAQLTVVARRVHAAADVARRAAPMAQGVIAVAAAWGAPEGQGRTTALAEADIVVNATPLGIDDLPIRLHALRPSCTVADVRYRPRPVDLVAAAEAAGHPACDGAGMLLCQGMLSFTAWTGQPPPWDAARSALMDALAR